MDKEKILQLAMECSKKSPNRPLIKDDEKANALLADIKNNPHVFVLGCLMDRQIPAEKAWKIPQKIFDILGTCQLEELAKVPLEKYVEIFATHKLHRFNETMAKVFHDGVQHIMKEYGGDASRIWSGKPSAGRVVERFEDFSGVGQKISNMAVGILYRKWHVEFSDYSAIDIAVDVHVERVMKRMGWVSQNASKDMIIAKAREICPEYPGILDSLFWHVGNKCCHEQEPQCQQCPLKAECKKIN
jgi:uncharacterized HhH-GPD family protein